MSRGRFRAGAILILALTAEWGCSAQRVAPPLTGADSVALADSVEALVTEAYDMSRPGLAERMLRLYPDSGAVYSAASGQVSTTGGQLEDQIGTFWRYVGSNMRDPRWEWTSMHVDVLSRDAAAMTAAYRIPHRTPRDEPHVIAGAWTAVLARRDGRWVVIQEHLSDLPDLPSRSGTAEDR